MSARSFISHRMFVAALGHDANATPGSRRPNRLATSLAGQSAPERGLAPEYRAPSPRAMAARRWLLAAINEGI
jgi:hypothetical protein